MNRSLMKHEFMIMGKSKKNILFITALAVLLLSYCFMILPNQKTIESFDPQAVQEELEELYMMQRAREETGATGFSAMTGMAFYAANEDYYHMNSKMITAFENKNYLRFLYLRLHFYAGNMANMEMDEDLFSKSPIPTKDKQHLYFKTLMRYEGYLDADVPITYELIEQKTALQTWEKLFLTSAVYLLLFSAIFFSSDVLVRDRKNQTVLQGLPVSWYRLLNIKTGVAFFYTIVVLFILGMIGMFMLSFLNGFGFFNIQVPVITFATRDFSMDDYDVISLAYFIALVMSFVPILIYLFIRLNILLSLILKNEWLVLMFSSLVLFSERIYFSRSLRELFGIDISYFPQTYFEMGKVVTGEKNFLVNVETITYGKGILVLLLTIVVVECLLLIVSRLINRRRFYK